jgi:hypothetical protein
VLEVNKPVLVIEVPELIVIIEVVAEEELDGNGVANTPDVDEEVHRHASDILVEEIGVAQTELDPGIPALRLS